jgi:hypothetical protein
LFGYSAQGAYETQQNDIASFSSTYQINNLERHAYVQTLSMKNTMFSTHRVEASGSAIYMVPYRRSIFVSVERCARLGRVSERQNVRTLERSLISTCYVLDM